MKKCKNCKKEMKEKNRDVCPSCIKKVMKKAKKEDEPYFHVPTD